MTRRTFTPTRGPAYVKLGRAVRYRPEDVDGFVASARVSPIGPVRAKRRSA